MAKGRELLANSVRDVLDAVLLRQQQGIISIESQQGTTLEEGEIYVQNQQVTYARTRQSTGQAALQEMLGWRSIRFSFEQPQRNTAALSPRPGSTVATGIQTSRSPSTRNSEAHLPITPPAIPQLTAPHSGQQPVAGVTEPAQSMPDIPAAGQDTLPPGMEWIIPRRTNDSLDVLSLPLTRTRRSIYLLVDGHRSIGDIARCTRKSLGDVEHLLREMQDKNLVAM